MSEEYMNGRHTARARQDQSHNSHQIEHSCEICPNTTSAAQVQFGSSIFGDSRLSGRGNAPVRQAAIQRMQHTHGNRAVQRAHSAYDVSQRIAVQRTPTETLATMEKIMGKDTPGFEYMRRQMGMEPGQAMHPLEAWTEAGMKNNPTWQYMQSIAGKEAPEPGEDPRGYANAKLNEAGGAEAAFAGMQGSTDIAGVPIDYKFPYAEGRAGVWDENKARRWGIKGNAGLGRVEINKGGDVSGDIGIGTAGLEASAGEDGVTLAVGASAIEGSVTLGKFDENSKTDEQARLGLSIGPSLGFRGHWGDFDKDGNREYGFGADIGAFSFDVKSEDPLRTAARLGGGSVVGDYMQGTNMTKLATQAIQDVSAEDVARVASNPVGSALNYLNPFSGDDGPSEAEQQVNQAAFIAKRDKELAEIEKNKDKIMKEQGPQAYYHMTTVANLPPQLRNLVDAASNTGPQ